MDRSGKIIAIVGIWASASLACLFVPTPPVLIASLLLAITGTVILVLL